MLDADHLKETNRGMQVQTFLNRLQKHRGFVYGDVWFTDEGRDLALTIDIVPHARDRPCCSGCGQLGPQYDRLPPRRRDGSMTGRDPAEAQRAKADKSLPPSHLTPSDQSVTSVSSSLRHLFGDHVAGAGRCAFRVCLKRF